METLFQSRADLHFDKFETYALQNIFALPRHVVIELPYQKVELCVIAIQSIICLQLDVD